MKVKLLSLAAVVLMATQLLTSCVTVTNTSVTPHNLGLPHRGEYLEFLGEVEVTASFSAYNYVINGTPTITRIMKNCRASCCLS